MCNLRDLLMQLAKQNNQSIIVNHFRSSMQLSDEEIARAILQDDQPREKWFKDNLPNLYPLIGFIQRMQPTPQSFDVVLELVKMYKISILRCFEHFYEKKPQARFRQIIAEKMRIIANIVFLLTQDLFQELAFYGVQGAQKRSCNYKLKKRTQQENQFIKHRLLIAEWIDLKDKYPYMNTLPGGVFEHIKSIERKHSQNKDNPFMYYYIGKMIQDLVIKFQVQKFEDLNPKPILIQEPKPQFQFEKIPQPKPFKLSIQSNSVQANFSPSNDPKSELDKDKLDKLKVEKKKNQNIWRLNLAEQISYRLSPNHKWKKIDGSLVKLSVAQDGRLWGVNSNEDIYTRPGVLGNWQQIPGKLIDISAHTNGEVWGINRHNQVYVRNDVEGKWKKVPGMQFQKLDEPNLVSNLENGSFEQKSSQKIIWALDSRGQISYRSSTDQKWNNIDGSLVQLSVAQDGRLWGVNSNEDIYTRPGVYGNWKQIPGKLIHISAHENGQVWGINKQNQVWVWNEAKGDWKKMPGMQFHKCDEPNVLK